MFAERYLKSVSEKSMELQAESFNNVADYKQEFEINLEKVMTKARKALDKN